MLPKSYFTRNLYHFTILYRSLSHYTILKNSVLTTSYRVVWRYLTIRKLYHIMYLHKTYIILYFTQFSTTSIFQNILFCHITLYLLHITHDTQLISHLIFIISTLHSLHTKYSITSYDIFVYIYFIF